MNIGKFIKNGDKFNGKIETRIFNETVVISPVTEKTKENAPDYRLYVGTCEVGAAWKERAENVGEYLSVKIDDVAVPVPINCALFKDTEGDGYTLVWERKTSVTKQ